MIDMKIMSSLIEWYIKSSSALKELRFSITIPVMIILGIIILLHFLLRIYQTYLKMFLGINKGL